MGFLFKYALASMAFAAILVYLYDHTIGHLINRVTTTVTNATVRAGVFVAAWTAATTLLGTRGFSKGVSTLREKTNEIAVLPKDVH